MALIAEYSGLLDDFSDILSSAVNQASQILPTYWKYKTAKEVAKTRSVMIGYPVGTPPILPQRPGVAYNPLPTPSPVTLPSSPSVSASRPTYPVTVKRDKVREYIPLVVGGAALFAVFLMLISRRRR